MEIKIDTYVEKIYSDIENGRSVKELVEEKDPMKIENDGQIRKFRFFDKVHLIKDGKTYELKQDYSNWIFFGEKINLDTIKDIDKYYSKSLPFKNAGYRTICHTQKGTFIPMDENDITYNELIAKNDEKNEEKFQEMINKLKSYIGKDIVLQSWIMGESHRRNVKLINVDDFNGIDTNSGYFPFIGDYSAIIEVRAKNNEILYENEHIRYGYNSDNLLHVYQITKMLAGCKIANEMLLTQYQIHTSEKSYSKKAVKTR